MAFTTLSPSPVLDLRGGNDAAQLGMLLGEMIKNLKRNPEEEKLSKLLDNPQLAEQTALAGHRLLAQAQEIDPAVKDLEGAIQILSSSLGDARVKTEDVGKGKDILPGGGLLPASSIQAIMNLHPGLAREAAVQRGMEGSVSVGDEVAARTRPIREAAAVDKAIPVDVIAKLKAKEAEGSLTEIEFKMLDFATKMRTQEELNKIMPPEDAARMILVQEKAKALGATLETEALQEIYDRKLSNIPEREKDAITAGLAGPQGGAWLQWIMSEKNLEQQKEFAAFQADLNLDRSKRLAEFQAALGGSGKTPEELFQSRTKFKFEVRDSMRATADRMKEASKDQLPALIAEFNSDAETLLLLDPAATVAMANEVRGIMRKNKITGVEFDITDITKSASGQIIALADTLAKTGMTQQSIQQLRGSDALKSILPNPLTGQSEVNEQAFNAVVTLAGQFKDNPEMWDELMGRAVQEVNTERQFPSGMAGLPARYKARQEEIEKLEAELASIGDTSAGPRTMTPRTGRASEIALRVAYLKMVNFLNKPPGI